MHFNSLSLHHLVLQFKCKGGKECADFIDFVSGKMGYALCSEEQTRCQSQCPLWHELRYGRITASKFHEVAHCRTSDGALVEGVHVTSAMKQGRVLERRVL